MDGGSFDLEVQLPSGGREFYTFPVTYTVDQVRTNIFRTSEWLNQQKDKPKYDIRISKGETLDVAFVKFVKHKSVYESLLKSGMAQVHFFDKTEQLQRKSSESDWMGATVQGSTWRHAGYTIEKSSERYPVLLTPIDGSSLVTFCERGMSTKSFLEATVTQLQGMLHEIKMQTEPTLFHPSNSEAFVGETALEEEPYVKACVTHDIIPELRINRNSRRSMIDVRSRARSFFFLDEPKGNSRRASALDFITSMSSAEHAPSEQVSQSPKASCSPAGSVKGPKDQEQNTLSSSTSGAENGEEIGKEQRGKTKSPVAKMNGTPPSIAPREDLAEDKAPLTIQLSLPDDALVISITCESRTSIKELKAIVKEKASEKGINLGDTEKYLIKVTDHGTYLTGDNNPLSIFPIIRSCLKKKLSPKLSLTENKESKKDKLVSLQIGNLIGKPLCWDSTDADEATHFRNQIRNAVVETNRPWQLALHAKLSDAPVPSTFPGKFLVKVYLPGADVDMISKTLYCTPLQTVNEVLAEVCRKSKTTHDLNPSSVALRICGTQKYISKNVALSAIVHIRECLKRNKKIFLVVVESEGLQLECDYSRSAAAAEREAEQVIKKGEYPGMQSQSQQQSLLESKLSLFELKQPFEVKVTCIEKLLATSDDPGGTDPCAGAQCFVQIGLFHGGENVMAHNEVSIMSTKHTELTDKPVWNEWLRSSVRTCNLPKAVRLCITAYVTSGKNAKPVAWVNCPLFDYRAQLLSGTLSLVMWPDGQANPIGTCVENLSARSGPVITLQFHHYPQPVVFPDIALLEKAGVPKATKTPSLEQQKKLSFLVKTDPLYRLKDEDKRLLWTHRDFCLTLSPNALIKLLASVRCTDRHAVKEAYRLLANSKPLPPADALELLDAKFADARVRQYAVNCLRPMSDEELKSYLLQLVQVLKYEPHHYSDLAYFLIERALRNRIEIGHPFFWHLQAEMHVPEIANRFGLLLEAYLRGCGDQRSSLLNEMDVIKKLKVASDNVKDIALTRRKAALHQELKKVVPTLPKRFSLPLDCTLEATGIVIDKCKCMDSAQAPLWIVFTNADPLGDDIYVIFKCGDDLRQDLLTLQMLRIMDQIWQGYDMDLHLTPYGCVATGDEMGMIEVVLNSETTADIQKAAGGVTAAFKQTPLANWLRSHNPTEELYQYAVQNFIWSCAGYCVATYVLGIGDRHNDNIMVVKDGHLFHIDYGHFLGNYKKFLTLRREKAPFVLTPEFAYVMGGEKHANFEKFTSLCCDAYVILRKHANVFINLFAMMLSTGIPELTCEEDIDYLRNAFSLELETTEEASAAFLKLIFESLNTKATQLNFAIHILAHRN